MIRKYVYRACLGNSFNPCSFGSADLERIFYQYDALCFRHDFGRRSNRQIKFVCSSRQGDALGDFQVGRADIVIDVDPRAVSAEFLRNCWAGWDVFRRNFFLSTCKWSRRSVF